MKYEIELSDETIEKIVDEELRDRLKLFEDESPTHPNDIAYFERQIPALKVVLEG